MRIFWSKRLMFPPPTKYASKSHVRGVLNLVCTRVCHTLNLVHVHVHVRVDVYTRVDLPVIEYICVHTKFSTYSWIYS